MFRFNPPSYLLQHIFCHIDWRLLKDLHEIFWSFARIKPLQIRSKSRINSQFYLYALWKFPAGLNKTQFAFPSTFNYLLWKHFGSSVVNYLILIRQNFHFKTAKGQQNLNSTFLCAKTLIILSKVCRFTRRSQVYDTARFEIIIETSRWQRCLVLKLCDCQPRSLYVKSNYKYCLTRVVPKQQTFLFISVIGWEYQFRMHKSEQETVFRYAFVIGNCQCQRRCDALIVLPHKRFQFLYFWMGGKKVISWQKNRRDAQICRQAFS